MAMKRRMKIWAKGLGSLGLLATCGAALAQYDIGGVHYTCPIGASWDDPRCIREPAGVGKGAAPDNRSWKSIWGAIALDITTGHVGTVTGRLSQSSAESEALGRCGTAKCEVLISYANECAVLVWPKAYTGRVVAQGGKTIDLASESALTECAGYGGQECKVVYSDCTRPVLD